MENNAEKNISTQHKQKRKESMKAYKKINPTMFLASLLWRVLLRF